MRLADLAAGVVLGGRFRLVEILGRGSYGDVWLVDVVSDETLPPQVAPSVIRATFAAHTGHIGLFPSFPAGGFARFLEVLGKAIE